MEKLKVGGGGGGNAVLSGASLNLVRGGDRGERERGGGGIVDN